MPELSPAFSHIFHSLALFANAGAASAGSNAEQWLLLPYWLLIAPLEWLMGQIFQLAYWLTDNLGLSILLLSAAVNTLLLPLYYLGDRIQQREQAVQARMQPKLDEFKRAFSGSTLHMVQKTFYRQNRYHPIYALRSSIGFAIQIPFFIAAYHFLSHLELLQGQTWGPIRDLSRPDALLSLPSDLRPYSNLLPWLMTLLNLLSSQAYISQSAYRSPAAKRQLWGIALLFLLLLYNSPAALLLYWSFSNLFSLCKNLISASKKQGMAYWFSLSCSCRATARRVCNYWVSLPYLLLLEYVLAVFGLFLLARFKVMDSVDAQAQRALFWGNTCWYGFALLQVLRNLARLLKNFTAGQIRKRYFPPAILLLLHSLLIAAAFIVVRISTVIHHLRTVELYALPSAILALSIVLAIWPRLWRSRPYRHLAELRHKPGLTQLGQLAASSTAALLGLTLFNSSALLFSSPSESPQAIPVLLGQLLPSLGFSLLLALLLLLLPLLLPSLRRKAGGSNMGSSSGLILPAYSRLLLLIAYFGSGALFLALANNFLLQHDYGVMTSWVFDQPEKLIIPFSTIFLVLIAIPLLFRLWLAMLQRLHILLPLCWILAASLWLSSAYYSHGLRQFQQNLQKHTVANTNDNLGTAYSFSRSQPNVLIMMLDRFIGPYLEDIMELAADVQDSLDGFTWYKNTTSPGPFTISGLTALLGGHEYSPEGIQQLPGSLQQKINQAYLLLPTLFQQNGFQATVSDPSWANFDWKGDLELFREHGIRAERLKGRYTGHWLRNREASDSSLENSGEIGHLPQPRYAAVMVLQAIFRALPSPLAPLVYDNGSWLGSNFSAGNLFSDLVNTWATLVSLPQISDANATQPQFIFMTNDTPHEPMAMGYNAADPRYPFQPMLETERPSPADSPLPPELFKQLMGDNSSDYSLRHFYADWATMRELQHYFRWMKENGVYDNSLIILASDHGRDIRLPRFELGPQEADFAYFMPLLMVKMPGASGPVQIDLEAHSSADVPAFASQILPPEQRRNPFTGKALQFQDSESPRFAYYISQNPSDQSSDRFVLQKSYRIDGPIWQRRSWQRLP